MENFKSLSRRIKHKWQQIDNFLYWGDNLDVRYYLCWKIKSLKAKRVLDIGCGPGVILSELEASNTIFGMDISESNIRISRQMNDAGRFVVGDMSGLPFKNRSFDVVMLSALLPLADDKEELIRSIYGLLKNNGLLLLTTHNRNYYAYKNNRTLLAHQEIENLLNKYFYIKIFGFNPLPRFPLFFPNVIIDRIPFIWDILAFFTRKNILSRISIGILVEGVKK